MRFVRTLPAICILVLFLCATTHATTVYRITDLGTLGGSSSYAYAINDNGWVVGSSSNTTGQEKAYLWKPATGMVALPTLGGPNARAYGINNSGQISGTADTEIQYEIGHPCLWSADGTPADLGGYSSWRYGRGYSLNDSGQVAGSVGLYALSWVAGSAPLPLGQDLLESEARAINDAGMIAGWYGDNFGSLNEPRYEWGPAYWQSGRLHALPTFNYGRDGYAYAINNANQIAGTVRVPGRGYQPCLWPNSTSVIPFGSLGGGYGWALGINESNNVVGKCQDQSSVYRAFIWESTAGIVDVNSLISPSSGWLLTEASDINNNGWIVGTGTINGQTHGFLLRPIPEPGGLLVLGSGLAGLLALRRRRA